MLHITRRPAGPLSALTAGSGDETAVVLVHGIFDSAACWLPVMTELASPARRVLAVDLPGHGASVLPEGAFSVPLLAEAVYAATRASGLERFHLVGHSLGGLVAQQLALTHPDAVSSLTLEDPAWGVTDDPGRTPPSLRERAEQLRTWTPQRILADGRLSHPDWDERDTAGWFEAKTDVRLELFDRPQEWVGATGATSWRGYDGPVCVLTGDAVDAIVTPAMIAQATAAAGPRLRRVHITGAGHNIRKDRPAAFIEALAEFLG